MHIGHWGEWQIKRRDVEIFPQRETKGPEEQEELMQKCGITKAVIVPHYVPDLEAPFKRYNPVVLDAVSALKNVKGGLWVSPLPDATELLQNILEQKPHKNIRALKMSANAWPGKINMSPASWKSEFRQNMELILDYAKKHDLTIHMHTGTGNSAVQYFIPFIEKYGDRARMQMVHMGNSASGVMAFVPRFIDWIEKGYDLYCDTSDCWGFGPNWLVKEAIKHHDPALKRILFASDNPWGVFEAEVAKIESSPISEDIKKMIFFENAEELYFK